MSARALPQHALVVGLGATGSAVARHLAAHGAAVRVADSGTDAALEARAAELHALGLHDITLSADLHDTRLLDGIDVVVPSPGVPEHAAPLPEALRRGLAVWSEPELAARLNAGATEIAAVTGTNGKTTTTELLAACLGAPAAGNIGTPLIDVLDTPSAPARVVAELSSFQLRFTDTLHTRVAVLLNIADDHLDWHGGLAAYQAAKARVWANHGADDWAVINHDDAGARRAADQHPPGGRIAGITAAGPGPGQVGLDGGWIVQRLDNRQDERVCALADMALAGPHNAVNACAATAAALLLGAPVEQIAQTLRTFVAGPHRMALVAQSAGVAWVDDSKATNPHAAAAALSAYPAVIWIAGGLNKGLAFDSLAGVLRDRVRLAVTIGSSAAQIAEVTAQAGVKTIHAGGLDKAVAIAAEHAEPGDTVLLSPACASMDQFRDYADRGRQFAALVRQRLGLPEGELA